eukprot:COSAG02_NODE_1066_length_14828_cov_8.021794_9_plen_94_part_00
MSVKIATLSHSHQRGRRGGLGAFQHGEGGAGDLRVLGLLQAALPDQGLDLRQRALQGAPQRPMRDGRAAGLGRRREGKWESASVVMGSEQVWQ